MRGKKNQKNCGGGGGGLCEKQGREQEGKEKRGERRRRKRRGPLEKRSKPIPGRGRERGDSWVRHGHKGLRKREIGSRGIERFGIKNK